jgi:hypothetical protein
MLRALTRASNVIETLYDAYGVWLAIAEEHEPLAWRSRERIEESRRPGAESASASAALSDEFHASLQAVVAAAIAVEALDYSETGGEKGPVASPPEKPRNVGDWIAARLAHARGLTNEEHDPLRDELSALFALRHDAVHPKPEKRSDIGPHPTGGDVPYELATFTAEAATKAVARARRCKTIPAV